MLYALICTDKPGALNIRKKNRDAHLEHLDKGGLKVVHAGPFLDIKGDMCGSLIVFDAPGVDAVEDWAERDPYAAAGLFESVVIRGWKKVIG